MGLLNSFARMAIGAAEKSEKQVAHAAGFAARRAAKAGTPAFKQASARMATVAHKGQVRAARYRYAASQLGELDKGVRVAGWASGVTPVTRAAGSVVRGTARAAGGLARPIAQHPQLMGAATVAAGVVTGVASGVRGTLRDANKQAGDPVGTYADLSIRTAFSGNPSDSRTKRGGASGDLTLNMGKR